MVLHVKKKILINPNTEPEIYFDRSDLKLWLEKLITRWLPMNLRTISLFYGADDAGKTHFLKHTQWHLLRRSENLSLYVDLRKITSDYDLYLSIMNALSRGGFISDFINRITSYKEERKINELTIGHTIGWVSSNLNYDPDIIYAWFYGNLEKIPGRWVTKIKNDNNIMNTVLSEILKAYYIMNDKKYPIFLFDHFEDIITSMQNNYMGEDLKYNTIKTLKILGNYSSLILSIDSENYLEYKEIYKGFENSQYLENQLHYLEEERYEQFLSDLSNHIVYKERISEMYVNSLNADENVTLSSYPFTEDSFIFLKSLKNVQPGFVLSVINKAIQFSEENEIEYVSRAITQKIVREIDPYRLIICPKCLRQLSQLNVTIETKHNRPTKITGIICPLCDSPVQDLLPFVLDKLVVDTSALVDLSVSALFEHLPSLGVSSTVQLYIPNAVLGELTGFEKRMDKLNATRSALAELRRIETLRRRSRLYIEQGVGREPTGAEIRRAHSSDSIDRIITEISKVLNATLLTSDKLLANNANAKGVFSILFIRKSIPIDVVSSRRRGRYR